MDTRTTLADQEKSAEYSKAAEFYFIGYCGACGTHARHGSQCSSCGFHFSKPADPLTAFETRASHQEHQNHG